MLMHMDHGGHDSDHETQSGGKTSEGNSSINDVSISTASVSGTSGSDPHEKKHKQSKKSRTLMFLGGIGMGLMMVLMVL